MEEWTVSPSNGVTNNNNGIFTFPKNSGTSKVTYTITYKDVNGCKGNTTYTLMPGPSCQPTSVKVSKGNVYYFKDCNNIEKIEFKISPAITIAKAKEIQFYMGFDNGFTIYNCNSTYIAHAYTFNIKLPQGTISTMTWVASDKTVNVDFDKNKNYDINSAVFGDNYSASWSTT